MSYLEFLDVDALETTRFSPRRASALARALGGGRELGTIRLRDATGSARVYEVNVETGELAFGDGVQGPRPPQGKTLVADYDGGDGGGGVDLTAGYAVIEIDGAQAERLLRRLTDLDLRELPAIGPVARVRTLVVRRGEGRFHLFVPQEYAHYVAEVALDAAAGLAR